MKLDEIFLRIEDTLEKHKDIPFGNSDVQNLYLLVQEEFSPGRRLRAYLLRLRDRYKAMRHAYYQLRKERVKLKRLMERLEKEGDKYERELLEIEIEEKLAEIKDVEKLYRDAVREAMVLLNAINELPPITREEFELQELEHFKGRLLSQLKQPPQVTGLQRLGYRVIAKNGEIDAVPDDMAFEKVKEGIARISKELSGVYNDKKILELPLLGERESEEEG